MKHAKPIKRALSVLLALVLSLSLVTPTWAAAKTPSSGTGNGLTWEKIDNRSTDLRLDKNNAEKVAQDTPEYADTDVVRVSIVLKDVSTLADTPAPAWQGIGILAALLLLHFGWQKWKGKAPSPIAMILVSAVLGLVVYH